MIYRNLFYQNEGQKCSLGDWSFSRKRGYYLWYIMIYFMVKSPLAPIPKWFHRWLWTNRWHNYIPIFYKVPWLVKELSCTCIVTSWSGHQPLKKMVMFPVFERWLVKFTDRNLTSKCNVTAMKSLSIKSIRSKDSKQVKSFLVMPSISL